jgi:hypothetical protein
MKPLSIADYLDRLGNPVEEKAPLRPEGALFRPRSLPSPQTARSGAKAVFDRITNKGSEAQGEEAPRRSPWAPKPALLESTARDSARTAEPAKPEDMAAKLADAYARGREEGLAEGRVETSERHAAELVAARELAETRQQELRLKDSAELEGAIRSGIKDIEDNVGGAVARILAPFLSQQVVQRAANELARAIGRISASNSPGLLKIRGPERVLTLLRQQIIDLPIKVEYVEDGRVETVVETNSTRIVAELRPWAELLASFEA